MSTSENQASSAITFEKFKILLVEDDSGVLSVIKAAILERFPDIGIRDVSDFSKALEDLKIEVPDVLILDIFDGDSVNGPEAGNRIVNQIWNGRLMPVIVYSAFADELTPALPNDHPLVKRIIKGSGTPAQVVEQISQLMPACELILEINKELKDVMHTLLKEVPLAVWKTESDESKRFSILKRLARRRLAATMDMETLLPGEKLKSWEIYVVPPFSSFLMGDIFKLVSGDITNPSSFRVILTPSCDLAHEKTDRVLFAECVSLTQCVIDGWKLPTPTKKNIEGKESSLNEPHVGGFVPLPALAGVLPSMAINLRKLEVVAFADLKLTGQDVKYEKVASIDSPFREFLAWAYLQLSGRPGMPERDNKAWIEEIVRVVVPIPPQQNQGS